MKNPQTVIGLEAYIDYGLCGKELECHTQQKAQVYLCNAVELCC